MLGIRLVRLIEQHSEALSRGLSEQIRSSERTSDFKQIPSKDLRLAATEVYRNLGEWLLQKTERDIATRFKAIAFRRSAEGYQPASVRVGIDAYSRSLVAFPAARGVR